MTLFFFFYTIVNYCICIKIVLILLVEVVSPTMLRGKTSNGFYNLKNLDQLI